MNLCLCFLIAIIFYLSNKNILCHILFLDLNFSLCVLMILFFLILQVDLIPAKLSTCKGRGENLRYHLHILIMRMMQVSHQDDACVDKEVGVGLLMHFRSQKCTHVILPYYQRNTLDEV